MKKSVLVVLIVIVLVFSFCSPALAQADPSPVPADEIILSTTYLELEVGDTYRLRADVLPTNAWMGIVKWRSSDDTVATVNQRFSTEPATSIGLIRAQGNGQATITFFIDDGSDDPLTAECIVVVGPVDPATDPSDPARPTPSTGGGGLTDNLLFTGFIALLASSAIIAVGRLITKTTR